MDSDTSPPPHLSSTWPGASLPPRPEPRHGVDRFRRGQRRVARLGVVALVGLGAFASIKVPEHLRNEAREREARRAAEEAASTPVPVRLQPVDAPERLSIPAIGVESPLVPLGATVEGAVEPPANAGDAGWFQGGPEPGEAGTAVIAGHVDSRTGPGVFYGLRDLKPGDPITINGAGGAQATYLVERTEVFSKAAVPASVYEPTPTPSLRLITCAGEFDRRSRHYQDNLVVYATLLS